MRVLIDDGTSTVDGPVYSAADIQNAAGRAFTVPVRNEDGDFLPIDASPGVSVASLLGVDPSEIHFVTITRGDRSPTILDNARTVHDLSAPDFRGGLVPSVQVDSSNLQYIRPLRNDDDVNVHEVFGVGVGALAVTVHTAGQVLHPIVSVTSPEPYRADAPITLTASAEAVPGLTFEWDFGDDKPDTGPTVQHRFAEGRWRPAVVVTGDDSSYGRALLPDVLQVGPPGDPGGGKKPGGGTGTPSAPDVGPKKGSGTKSGGAVTPAPGRGDQPGAGAGTTAPTGSGSGSGAGTTGRAAPRSGGPTIGSSTARRADGAGTLVSGQLLTAPQGAVEAAGASESPGQASAPSARRRPHDRLDLRGLGWLVPITLVGLGVFGERRRPRARGSAL